MLDKWLEGLCEEGKEKTAADQFKEELDKLSADELELLYTLENEKIKEAQGYLAPTLRGALGGATTGGLAGASLGGVSGALAAPQGQRLEGLGRGAVSGGLTGAAVGGLGGALLGQPASRVRALQEAGEDLPSELLTRSELGRSIGGYGALLGLAPTTVAAGILAGKKVEKKKEKKSYDLRALVKKASAKNRLREALLRAVK
jgi:hypothetical protein